jgi:hypothetical protein
MVPDPKQKSEIDPMKRTHPIILLLFLSTSIASGQWIADIERAAQVAANDDKKILLFIKGTGWCPHCDVLEREILGGQEFISAASDSYALLEVDLPRDFQGADAATTVLTQFFDVSQFGVPYLHVLGRDLTPIARIARIQGESVRDFHERLDSLATNSSRSSEQRDNLRRRLQAAGVDLPHAEEEEDVSADDEWIVPDGLTWHTDIESLNHSMRQSGKLGLIFFSGGWVPNSWQLQEEVFNSPKFHDLAGMRYELAVLETPDPSRGFAYSLPQARMHELIAASLQYQITKIPSVVVIDVAGQFQRIDGYGYYRGGIITDPFGRPLTDNIRGGLLQEKNYYLDILSNFAQ